MRKTKLILCTAIISAIFCSCSNKNLSTEKIEKPSVPAKTTTVTTTASVTESTPQTTTTKIPETTTTTITTTKPETTTTIKTTPVTTAATTTTTVTTAAPPVANFITTTIPEIKDVESLKAAMTMMGYDNYEDCLRDYGYSDEDAKKFTCLFCSHINKRDPIILQNQINLEANAALWQEDGSLVLYGYFSNGYQSAAYNINVEHVVIYDKYGNVVAESDFGILASPDNPGSVGAIAANTTVTIPILFTSDKVYMPFADLSEYVGVQSNISNNY